MVKIFNYRIVWVGRGHKANLVLIPLPRERMPSTISGLQRWSLLASLWYDKKKIWHSWPFRKMPSTRSHFRSHHLQLVLLHKGRFCYTCTGASPCEVRCTIAHHLCHCNCQSSHILTVLVGCFVHFFSSEGYFPVIFLLLSQDCHEHRHLALRSYMVMFTYQLIYWELVQVTPSVAGLGFIWKME